MSLYHENNKVDESSDVHYNLMEDVRCLKEDVQRLTVELEATKKEWHYEQGLRENTQVQLAEKIEEAEQQHKLRLKETESFNRIYLENKELQAALKRIVEAKRIKQSMDFQRHMLDVYGAIEAAAPLIEKVKS